MSIMELQEDTWVCIVLKDGTRAVGVVQMQDEEVVVAYTDEEGAFDDAYESDIHKCCEIDVDWEEGLHDRTT